jgi:Xaa-Pro aminopeptidase
MKPYIDRRAAVIAHMQAMGGGIAVIPTAPEVIRNNDADYPYRHDSYFYYLSGFTEPEAVIVLIADATHQSIQSFLFCREKNLEREIWDGYRYGPEVARSTFGFDAAFPIESLDTEMPKLIANSPALFYAFGHSTGLDSRIQGWLAAVRKQVRAGISAPATLQDINGILNEMRLIKDTSEIATMQRAAAISAEAHCRAMRATRPGLCEYHLEAELLYEFRRQGAQAPAYSSIVATGANVCILHYRADKAILKNGDLVLIDAACELDSYASDITRTFPVNGIFSGSQKTLYDIVLAAQAAAIAAIMPGKRFNDGHDAAVRILAQGMLDTGLLDKNIVGTLDDVLEKGSYRQFYMHRTGHWIGMDVHDVGEYRDAAPAGTEKPSRTLQPGMALTVEPGLYVRPAEGVPEQFWHIGIRIEDDVVVTENGCTVLTDGVPKTVAAIEALMKS